MQLLGDFGQIRVGDSSAILRVGGGLRPLRRRSGLVGKLLQRGAVLTVARHLELRLRRLREASHHGQHQPDFHNSATFRSTSRKYNPSTNSKVPFTSSITGAENIGTRNPVARLPLPIPPPKTTFSTPTTPPTLSFPPSPAT